MNSEKKTTLILALAFSVYVLSSCATGIKPPSPSAQTLLVLPVNSTNETQLKTHGYYYIYEIVSLDEFGISYKAIIKLPLKEGMLIIDWLPPGNYAVRKFVFLPLGSGDHTYGENIEIRDDRFILEAGKITIFPQSLNVRLYNEIPGRGMSTSYQIGIHDLSRTQRSVIQDKLKQIPNFNNWEISDKEISKTSVQVTGNEAVILPKPMLPVSDVSGTYMSSVTGDVHGSAILGTSPRVELVQTGNKITGTFGDRGGKIWGDILVGKIEFEFFTSGSHSGRGEWIFKSASEADGTWSHGHSFGSAGIWNLKKIE